MGAGLAVQAMLAGMPVPADLCRTEVDGRVVISLGAVSLFDYEASDAGLRNLAAVTLPELGFAARRVAEVVGITEEYVSMLRGRARRDGSAALAPRRGRPPTVGPAAVARARKWRAAAVSNKEIGRRLGVHATTVARLLGPIGAAGPEPVQVPEQGVLAGSDPSETEAEVSVPEDAVPFSGSARVGVGVRASRYAGAMLLYGYLDGVGAEGIFGSLTGAPARRYDDAAVLACATVGFALGIDTVEGAKHLRRGEAGAVVGLDVLPQLGTFRARLAALGDGSDLLATQRAFAQGMLNFDPAADPVTSWTTMPGVLAQLRTVIGPDAPVLLGFDRGGAYPASFRACRDAGADWVTYRRAPLTAATVAPNKSWTVRDGRRIVVTLADEIVDLKGYGPARQLTLYEHGVVVLQVLTSDTAATGAALLWWLRARWRIENVFKYAAAHNGIDALADYRMGLRADTPKVPNPARAAARTAVTNAVTNAEAEAVTAERSLAQLLASPLTPKAKNAALPGVHRRIAVTAAAHQAAKEALRPVPAKITATDLNADATIARPRLERRGLQMVLRLLAYNAEAWLAERFNAYLADPDEYRAILRHLLHLGGTITYTTTTITVTLDRPDSPRVARSLQLLTEELNNLTAHLPGDPRPINYTISGPQVTTVTQPQPEEV